MGRVTRETKDKFAKKWETVIDEFFINTNKVPYPQIRNLGMNP